MLVQAVLIRHIVKRVGEVGTMGVGSLLLIAGQALTVLAVVGLLPGENYPLVQTVIASTAICFGFALASPALSSAASKIAGSSSRGGSLGVCGFASSARSSCGHAGLFMTGGTNIRSPLRGDDRSVSSAAMAGKAGRV